MRRSVLLIITVLAVVAGDRPSAGEEVKKEEKKRQVAQPAAVIRGQVVGDADDAVIKQIEQRYGKQVRGRFKAEVNFIKEVAGPTNEQVNKICADAAPSTKTAVRQLALQWQGRGDNHADPGREMVKALVDAAKGTLTAEQFARYKKELDARTAARKRLCVANLVAMTDRALHLRPDQRNQLTEVLTANWDDAWDQPRMYMFNNRYFPNMPDARIVPLLTESQKAVWDSIPKTTINYVSWWFAGWGFVEVDVDDVDKIIDAAADR